MGGGALARLDRVGEGRVGDEVAEVRAVVAGDKAFDDVGLDSAPGGVGLVGEASEEGLDDAVLEVDAGVLGDYLVAEVGGPYGWRDWRSG